MGQPPDVFHCHDEVAGRLEQLHCLVMGDAEEAPAIHLQDLVSYLQSQDGVSLAGLGAFLLGIRLLLPPGRSYSVYPTTKLGPQQLEAPRKTRERGQVVVAGDQALKPTASNGPGCEAWRSLFRIPSQTNLSSSLD